MIMTIPQNDPVRIRFAKNAAYIINPCKYQITYCFHISLLFFLKAGSLLVPPKNRLTQTFFFIIPNNLTNTSHRFFFET